MDQKVLIYIIVKYFLCKHAIIIDVILMLRLSLVLSNSEKGLYTQDFMQT